MNLTFTEEKILLLLAEMHPFEHEEIRDVYKITKSIDSTIALIYIAYQVKTPLVKLAEMEEWND